MCGCERIHRSEIDPFLDKDRSCEIDDHSKQHVGAPIEQ